MKSTGWSLKRTSNDDYLVKQHLRVNATTGCKIYSTEHTEALHRAQTALARLNLVSITILENLRDRCLGMRLHAIDVYDR